MSCEQTRRLATLKKIWIFKKSHFFSLSKKLQKLQKKEILPVKTKRRNKILRHNNKHTQTFFKKQKLLPTILLKIREKNLPPPIITSKTTMFSSLKNIYIILMKF